MRDSRPGPTGQRQSATATRALLLSLTVGSLSCGGGGDGRDDSPTNPSDTDFTGNASVQGTFNLAELNVAAGLTITATGNLVCEISGDITIDGNLVGDYVEIMVSGQGRLTINGTIRNECSVRPAAGQAPPLAINNKGDMSFTGATIRSSGWIEVRNSSLGEPNFRGGVQDVPPPPGEPEALLTIVNSTIEAEPGRALDGQAGPVGSVGEATPERLICRAFTLNQGFGLGGRMNADSSVFRQVRAEVGTQHEDLGPLRRDDVAR